jgi:hypothetical protein
MNNKLKPAILGGLIVGVLSGLLSFIPFVNYCCCIWSIGGGVLAAFLYIKSSATPVGMGDGAMVGGLAGVVGGILYLIINLPITLLIVGVAGMNSQLSQAGVKLPFGPIVLVFISSIVTAVILAGLATLGGVIGVAIFEKRKGDGLAPPPPQNFGGAPGV